MSGEPPDLPPPAELRGRFDLAGRVALVAGAASGLGAAIAWGLACFGADLVLADANEAPAAELGERVRTELGRRAVAAEVDVTRPDQVAAMVRRALDAYGALDVCVNAAGVNRRLPALELPLEDFDRVPDVNLRGTFLCARAAGAVMVERGRGKVINVSSVLGHTALPSQAAYASSKGAVNQLTKVLALEWARHNVQVNALSPAHFDTPLTRSLTPEQRAEALDRIPLGRFGRPHEVIAPAVFLASAASDFLTGATLAVADLEVAQGVHVRAGLRRAGDDLRDQSTRLSPSPPPGLAWWAVVTSVWRKWRPGNTGARASSTRPSSYIRPACTSRTAAGRLAASTDSARRARRRSLR